jgi:hypothetical protein
MLTSEFIAALDAIRSSVRANNPKLKGNIQAKDEAAQSLLRLAQELVSEPVAPSLPPVPVEKVVEPDIWSQPEPEQEAPKVLEIVERGDGEGRMIVMGRDKPFVPKKPVLEEVQEGELGK